MSKTFPKEGIKKLKEVIRIMKGELRQKEKEIDFLQRELENITKPVRERKTKEVVNPNEELDSWRLDFMKRFKKETQ